MGRIVAFFITIAIASVVFLYLGSQRTPTFDPFAMDSVRYRPDSLLLLQTEKGGSEYCFFSFRDGQKYRWPVGGLGSPIFEGQIQNLEGQNVDGQLCTTIEFAPIVFPPSRGA